MHERRRGAVLQNPFDLEATFRSKAGKEHCGYVAKLEESVGANGFVVTGDQYEQNIHIDSQFIREHFEQVALNSTKRVRKSSGALWDMCPKAVPDMKQSSQCAVFFLHEQCADYLYQD